MKLIKRICTFIIKALYLSPFFAMSIWLLGMLYFPQDQKEPKAATMEYLGKAMVLVDTKKDEPVPHSHFHITDEYIARMEAIQSLCMKCHGIYPHIKDIRTVALRNLHTGFLACEVCHIHNESGKDNHNFAWADFETGEISMRVEGGYGKYSAKIVPVKNVNGELLRLDILTENKFAEGYATLTDKKHTHEQQQAVVKKMHDDNLSEKPVTCLECHRRNGYMDFLKLGFHRGRINQLSSSEVSRMVGHYKTFYMPKMLNME